jgi:hypothetical protein
MTMASATRSAHELLHDRAGYFPRDLSQTCTYEEDDIVANTLSGPFKFPLFQLTVSGQTLFASKPIGIKVTQDGPWFFAENETLKVVGTGESYEEAVRDLEQHIIHFWRYYQSLQDSQVTGDAVRLKGLFSNLFSDLLRAA